MILKWKFSRVEGKPRVTSRRVAMTAAALSGALRKLALVRDEQSAEFRRGNSIARL